MARKLLAPTCAPAAGPKRISRRRVWQAACIGVVLLFCASAPVRQHSGWRRTIRSTMKAPSKSTLDDILRTSLEGLEQTPLDEQTPRDEQIPRDEQSMLPRRDESPLSSSRFQLDDDNCKSLFVRSGGVSIEGYGSFFQRIKSSVILSMALNRTLILPEDILSQHKYSVTAQINEAYGHARAHNTERHRYCVPRMIQHHLPACDLQPLDNEAEILDEACRAMHGGGAREKHRPALSGVPLSSWSTLVQASRSCSDLYQTKVQVSKLVFTERHEGFNDCIQPWLSMTFRKMFERRAYRLPSAWQTDLVHVGIHIRWGDVATANVTAGLDSRSIQLSELHSCVGTLRKTGRRFKFHVFVKNPTEVLLSHIEFEHTIVNSPDDLYDMFLYSQMSMYIQGTSSYSVVASLINPGKVIITNVPSSEKYQFDYFPVNTVLGVEDVCHS